MHRIFGKNTERILMCDIKSNTLQIIGVKQEGNVPRQAHAPQGTKEPANRFPFDRARAKN